MWSYIVGLKYAWFRKHPRREIEICTFQSCEGILLGKTTCFKSTKMNEDQLLKDRLGVIAGLE
jgi:hypothetical protein